MQIDVQERNDPDTGGWEVFFKDDNFQTMRYIIPINGLFYAVNPFKLEQSPVFSDKDAAMTYLIDSVDEQQRRC